MKIKSISELISVFVIGTLVGLLSNEMHVKWHSLGREAFLSHESQIFDHLYAKPTPMIRSIATGLTLALLTFVLYKGVAFLAAKILSAITNKGDTEQGER
jgi:hypothetical protein